MMIIEFSFHIPIEISVLAGLGSILVLETASNAIDDAG